MKTLKVAPILLVFFYFLASYGFTYEARPLPKFTADDRILILAPHPDDETIGTGGVLQRALKAGAEVKVVLYTNGENNELAFIVYEKHIVVKQKAFLKLGELRSQETIKAMNYLGLKKEDIIFLGYPDFGTMEIMLRYWGDTAPFRSMLAKVNKVSYPEALSRNAPFVGESILNDLKKVIREFRPTKIFVSHPADTNRDHRALYLFLRVALWDLEGKMPMPLFFPYIVHVVGWPQRGYEPNVELSPPEQLEDSNIIWRKLDLSEEEVQKKYNATDFYKSQISYNPRYLLSFARKNELFGDYPVVHLKGRVSKDEDEEELDTENKGRKPFISDVVYERTATDLVIKLKLLKRTSRRLGLLIYLLGYNKDKDFSNMPKLSIYTGKWGLYIKDKKEAISVKDATLQYKDKAIVIKVPLSSLGNPDYILACVMTSTKYLSTSQHAWRILYLD